MKKLLLILGTLSAFFGQAQPSPSPFYTVQTLNTFGLISHVKSVSEKSYSAREESDGTYTILKVEWKDWSRNSEMTFDSIGRLRKKNYYDDYGNPDGIEENHIVNDKLIWAKYGERLMTCRYDNSGKLLSYIFKQQPSNTSFDESNGSAINGNKIVDFHYEDNNRVRKVKTTTTSNSFEQFYEYDSQNKITKVSHLSDDAWEYEQFSYDSKGRITQYILKNEDSILITQAYVYLEENLISNTIIWSNFFGTSKKDSVYYTNALITEKIRFDGEEKKVSHETYTYEFDGNNNWIKQIVTIDEKRVFVITRDIDYFD